MASHHPRIPRFAAAAVTFILVTLIGTLVLDTSASAQVSIVPGTVKGGGTETFAIRLANESKDTSSNRLELVFAKDIPISSVKVSPARGWTVTVNRRPLASPAKVNGHVIDEVVRSIVWQDSRVGPGQFEQFLVRIGPLPRNGLLRFRAVQNYVNGEVDTWNFPPVSGSAPNTGPAITIGSGAVSTPSASTRPAPDDAATADRPDSAERPGTVAESSRQRGPGLLLGVLGAGLAIALAAWLYSRSRSTRADLTGEAAQPAEASHSDVVEAPEVRDVSTR